MKLLHHILVTLNFLATLFVIPLLSMEAEVNKLENHERAQTTRETKCSNFPSLKQLCFERCSAQLKETVYPQLVQGLSETIATQFPDTHQKLSFETALSTLIAISNTQVGTSFLNLTPISLTHTLNKELDVQFKTVFEEELKSPLLSKPLSQERGLLAPCLELVALRYYYYSQFYCTPKEDTFEQSYPLLWSIVMQKVDHVLKILDTEYLLPEEQVLKAQLMPFEDVLNNCNLLIWLGGKEIMVRSIAVMLEVALYDYAAYFEKKKMYPTNEIPSYILNLKEQMLAVILKEYPYELSTLIKTEATMAALIAEHNARHKQRITYSK